MIVVIYRFLIGPHFYIKLKLNFSPRIPEAWEALIPNIASLGYGNDEGMLQKEEPQRATQRCRIHELVGINGLLRRPVRVRLRHRPVKICATQF
jgi:hypothetical protein